MRTRKLSPKTQTHKKLSVFLNTGSIRSEQRGLDSFYSLKSFISSTDSKEESVAFRNTAKDMQWSVSEVEFKHRSFSRVGSLTSVKTVRSQSFTTDGRCVPTVTDSLYCVWKKLWGNKNRTVLIEQKKRV